MTTKLTQRTMERAEACYENRPCQFMDAEGQTLREFAQRLAKYNGMATTPALTRAIVSIVIREENPQ